MKKLLWMFIPVLMISLFAVSVSASAQLVYDNANILTDDDEAYLESLAASEGDKYGISIVILTENGIGNTDPMNYAADFYDFGGFEPDGVIMFLDMGERDWRIVNTGSMMDVIGDYELDYIAEYAVPWFSDGDYKTGFEQYIIIASALTDRHANGSFTGDYYLEGYDPEAYNAPSDEYYYNDGRTPEPGYYQDYVSYYESPGVGGMYYFIAAIAAVIIAFVVCQCFKSQLNTAVPKNNASSYFDENNAVLTVSKDKFLYSRVTKIKRDTDENRPSGGGHRSGGGMHSFSGSSGRSHSGGGGKF